MTTPGAVPVAGPGKGSRGALFFLALALCPAASAQVVLDGTLGRAGALAGPDFAVTADLGRQVGANLFHSFSQFGLSQGQVATFSGPADVARLISRVTGGGASSIDGTIRSTIAGADFYLFNPAGVAFGPHASIDVGGAFHVGSAHSLRLAGGGRFDAANPPASTLTAAAPEAFGFLGGQGDVSFTGSRITTRTGAALLVAGGTVRVQDGAFLMASAAPLGIASVSGAGEVSFGPAGLGAVSGQGGLVAFRDGIAITDSASAHPAGSLRIVGGSVDLEGESTLSASTIVGGAGGDLSIAANDLEVSDRSRIMAMTWGSGDAGSIRLDVAQRIVVEDAAAITAQTQGSGAAGDIRIRTDVLSVSDGSIGTTTFSTGRGGSITVDAGEVLLDNGYLTCNSSWIGSGDAGSLTVRASRRIVIHGPYAAFSATTAEGRGGSILVETPSLAIDRVGHINTFTTGSGDAGDITLRVGELNMDYLGYLSASSREEASGRGGSILIEAGTMTLTRSAQVLSSTLGTGRGGNVRVVADRLSLESSSRLSAATAGSGPGGSVIVEVGDLELTGLGYLDATSSGSGAGGQIAVTASRGITLSGSEDLHASGMFASARGTGDGGTIAVRAPSLVVDGAVITTQTTGPGRGGPIRLEVGDLLLSNGGIVISNTTAAGAAGDVFVTATGSVTATGTGNPGMSGLYAETRGAGRGGRIDVTAPLVVLADEAILSARSGGTGAAGSIRVAADTLSITSRASIETQTLHADGGDIAIESGALVHLDGGVISTSVQGGAGNGGNIAIARPLHVVLRDGVVSANAWGGDGGNIAIDSSYFLASPSSVVEASSRLGVSGTITVTAPVVDVGAGLGVLPAGFFDATRLLREACASRAGESENSFVVVGRGAMPESAWSAYPGARPRPAAAPCGGSSK
ncbi:MAG: filamentous hemagglutinin N-terminal domain-containing protein [Burkholderiales bacterium]|nr:filamentous hemagglutinin N-terminal domain-containing protein [Burkholderiales bacterium]